MELKRLLNTEYYYLSDHLGSIRVVLKEDGNLESWSDYYPFGKESRGSSTSNEPKEQFSGKPFDDEIGLNYFGSRYFNPDVGRFISSDKYSFKYPAMTPYQYAANNPIYFIDINGDSLDVGGNKELAFSRLQGLLGKDDQSRLTVDENGRISFNIEGLDLSSDASYGLLNSIVNGEDKFLFEAVDNTEGTDRNTGESVKDDMSNGVANYSVTERNTDGGVGGAGLAPKSGYAGQVSLGTGSWNYLTTEGKNSGNTQPTSNITFHELFENHNRTVGGQPYKRMDGSGAHQNAINNSLKWRGYVPATGMQDGGGVYVKPKK